MSNEFQIMTADKTVKKLKYFLQKIINILESYNISENAIIKNGDIRSKDLLLIMDAADKISGVMRTLYTEEIEKSNIEPIYNNLVEIKYDSTMLFLSVPTLINRDKKHSYYIAGIISYALEDYILKNNITRPAVNSPVVIAIVRYVNNPVFISDNDNAEYKRIQNSICRNIGISDTPDLLSNFYITKVSSSAEEHTEVFVFPKNKMNSYLSLLL